MQTRNCRLGGHLVGQAANGAVLAPSPSRQAPPFVGPGKWKVIMAGYYLFFRCWPGFTEPFPFNRFSSLPDVELAKALDAYAREQIRAEKPAIKRIIRERKRKLGRKPSRIQAPWKPPNPQRQHYDNRVRGASRGDPPVCRVGAYLGWWNCTDATVAHLWIRDEVAAPRVWVREVADQDLAEHLAAQLNTQKRLNLHKDEAQCLYLLNPHFGCIPSEEGFSTAQRALVHRHINAIRNGKELAVSHATIALWIGQWALHVAEEVIAAWGEVTNAGGTSQQTPEETVPTEDDFSEQGASEQPGGEADKITQSEDKPKGGRPREWDDLLKLYDRMKREDPKVTKKEVVRAYNGRHAAPIADGRRRKATPKALCDALYRRKKVVSRNSRVSKIADSQ